MIRHKDKNYTFLALNFTLAHVWMIMEIELDVRTLFPSRFLGHKQNNKIRVSEFFFFFCILLFLHVRLCNSFYKIRWTIAVAFVVTRENIDFPFTSCTTTIFSLLLSLSSEISPLLFFAFVRCVLVISLFTHILKERRVYMNESGNTRRHSFLESLLLRFCITGMVEPRQAFEKI